MVGMKSASAARPGVTLGTCGGGASVWAQATERRGQSRKATEPAPRGGGVHWREQDHRIVFIQLERPARGPA